MIKNTVIALVTAAALAGVAAPAMASTSSLLETADTTNFDAAYVQAQLEAKGLNVTQVEEWGEYVAALVVDADGKSTFSYFKPTTLEQVNF
ncbi:Peptidase propeptide and YPEB domain-containing protein [Devosia lucknowensis]|uniref:Peptidase propeptide and YPEB domain-containing protein n=1 Tax=Devosia lucknowensis TaxID=1096929 RepID=A0A1Y6G7T4_9HYPH|nr:PepSY domain-containing protein [Devosia lucknowensis]SMQ85814.1 Peptidase propeptide and YPEB domain-containing protein [Devosia lucknowensis]